MSPRAKAPLAPRRTSHRGFLPAAGFWFDPSLAGADAVAGRILSLWREGCVLHAAAGGVLLVLPSPVLAESRRAPGVVLTRRDGLLAGFPATDREIARLAPPPGSALLCRGGRVLVCPLSRETALDPADWLDVAGFAARESRPLGEPPAPAAVSPGIEPPPLESHFDPEFTRPPEKKARLLGALAKALTKKDAGDGRPGRAPREQGTGLSFGTIGLFIRRLLVIAALVLVLRLASEAALDLLSLIAVLVIMSYMIRSSFDSSPSSFKGLGSWLWGSKKARPARRARSVSRLVIALRSARWFLGSLIGRTPAARLLGRRQASYMHKMTRMFEENDLDQALRHAVPLATLGDMVRAAPGFFRPTPRTDLTIGLGGKGVPVRLIMLTAEYQKHLTDLYRAACARLEQAGQIEKAAFVLLELLQQNEEAIALLERHGRFRFAAEVAQARKLPPGMVVRLWFLAGEPAQAMRVARTTGAFPDAVARLERTHPDEAKKMRILWASFLAEAGNYGGAVDAAWPVPEARRLLLEWMERGIRLEGPIAARLIVKKIALEPGSLEALMPKIEEILHDTLPGSLRARLSLGKAILEHEDRQDLRALSGFVLRHLLQDLHAVPFNPGFGSVVQGLKKTTADRLLVEDLPSHAFPVPAAGSGEARVIRCDAGDVGLHRLYDGVSLPSGRLVVALGEAGVQVLSRRGALIAHIDQPADELVLNDSGNHAIAAARRGEVCRLARLDLEKLRGDYWCDALVDNAAETFDGEVWFVSHGDTLMAVDAMADRFVSLWRLGDLEGPVLALARNASSLSVAVGAPHGPEHWQYELPKLTLRQRYEMSVKDDLVGLFKVAAKEHYGFCRLTPGDPESGPGRFFISVGTKGDKAVWQSREIQGFPGLFRLYNRTAAVVTETPEGLRVSFFRWPGETGGPVVELDLAGAGAVSVRRYANTFCVTDDRGRLLVLSAEDFRLVREARL